MADPVSRRAYSILNVKSVDDEQRIIEGIASTPVPDRVGDVVEPEGAQYALPMPLLWQHRTAEPIGQVLDAKVTPDGIAVKARIAKGILPRIDEAWALIKSGLVRGLSIGFKAVESADIKGTFGTRFLKWEWLELSVVTIPANADASIAVVKSCDTEPAAAPGTAGRVVRLTPPGASGSTRASARTGTSVAKKTLAEQIRDFEAQRAAKAAELEAIQTKAVEEGRSKDEAEKEAFKNAEADIASIDAELADLRKMEQIMAKAAQPVSGTDAREAATSRGSHVVVTEQKLPPGIRFARWCIAVAKSKGNPMLAQHYIKADWPDDSQLNAAARLAVSLGTSDVVSAVKGAVGAGAAQTSNWIDDLVPYNAIASDFIEYLRPRTIIDRFGQGNIPSLRRVPFNIRVGGFSAGTTGYWKGEGLAIPVSKATSTYKSLTWATVGGLVVLTQEAVRFSTPSVEAMVRADLAAAVAARMDIDFVDPSKAAVANTSPASVTNAIAAHAPSGTTAAKLRKDLADLYTHFVNMPGLPVLIMSQTQALQVAGMVNTLGNRDFPDFTPQGGSIDGIPCLVSEHLTSVGSPSTQEIVALMPNEVYLADDGQVTVDASDQASVEMQDSMTQTGIAGTGASLVSLWQAGLLGLRAERVVNWVLRRSTAAQYISPAAYVIQ